jgi:hypothetical protein
VRRARAVRRTLQTVCYPATAPLNRDRGGHRSGSRFVTPASHLRYRATHPATKTVSATLRRPSGFSRPGTRLVRGDQQDERQRTTVLSTITHQDRTTSPEDGSRTSDPPWSAVEPGSGAGPGPRAQTDRLKPRRPKPTCPPIPYTFAELTTAPGRSRIFAQVRRVYFSRRSGVHSVFRRPSERELIL